LNGINDNNGINAQSTKEDEESEISKEKNSIENQNKV
jgi:hypothetical protein